jgi:hypothetical protein
MGKLDDGQKNKIQSLIAQAKQMGLE